MADTPDLSTESPEDLVEFATWAQSDPEIAKAAMWELWRRFMPYVFAALWRSFGWRFSREELVDFTNDSFLRAAERGGSFRNEGIEDTTRAFNKVGAWLCAIARSVVADSDRERDGMPEPWSVEEFDAVEAGTERSGPVDHRLTAIREAAFETGVLNEREREVVLTTIEYYKPGADHQRLPNGVAEALARRLDVQPETITQIRRRAFQKIMQFVESATERRGVEAAS